MVMFLQFVSALQERKQNLGRLPVDRHGDGSPRDEAPAATMAMAMAMDRILKP